MRFSRVFLGLLATVMVWFAVAPVAFADWIVGDPFKMHYPQLPDLTETGLDVLATALPPTVGRSKILADDWLCTETGPVSDIHIWGSWLNDRLPTDAAGNLRPDLVTFKLSIHSNIPGDPTGNFSHPGPELWSGLFDAATFKVRLDGTGPERFYDPNIGQIIGTDTQVWQYNFTNIPNPFPQQRGEIYWLDVQAQPKDLSTVFGWKTTNPRDPRTPHFMDDAVFADTAGFNGPLTTSWQPMVYPVGQHPYGGHSIDQAFVITPEPSALVMFLVVGAMALLAFARDRWARKT